MEFLQFLLKKMTMGNTVLRKRKMFSLGYVASSVGIILVLTWYRCNTCTWLLIVPLCVLQPLLRIWKSLSNSWSSAFQVLPAQNLLHKPRCALGLETYLYISADQGGLLKAPTNLGMLRPFVIAAIFYFLFSSLVHKRNSKYCSHLLLARIWLQVVPNFSHAELYEGVQTLRPGKGSSEEQFERPEWSK